MHKILIFTIIFLGVIPTYAQDLTLDFCVGTWKYANSSTGEEFTMKLKKALDEIPSALGGGMMDCLIGVYAHKKNGVVLTDCLNQFTTINAKSSPIWAIETTDDRVAFIIEDFKTKNGWGKTKKIGRPSGLYFYSQSPKQIRMVLVHQKKDISICFDEKDIFPDGTSLPTDIVLTKIE